MSMDAPKSPVANAPILIFDGSCGFCSSSVRFAARWLPAMPQALPYQFAELDSIGLTEIQAAEKVWLALPGDQEIELFGGHLAVAEVLRHQPSFGFRLLGNLMELPGVSQVSALAYALAAKYRHKLPGGTPACEMARRT
ncbi:MAG: DUF393 domain-containing protein [Microbacteriaceae bacterium]|nr:DUF393 domain-containing protein [Cryobacterium sp.]MCC6376542.1 DUF393 domain-containing protein [Microbacteriaceae bacterium]